ncbi:hypothetical protein [Vibrio alfacsensis]|uniref:hypothetical protein n=2 Tax=Vibrionaceae TaxID=641 RepID=UPI004068157C
MKLLGDYIDEIISAHPDVADKIIKKNVNEIEIIYGDILGDIIYITLKGEMDDK